jgi:DNA-binding NarL/FixJ family response regulator
MAIQILMVDDHEIVRLGLKQLLLQSEDEISITAEASNSSEGFAIFQSGHFDLVLVEVRLPEGDGLQLISRIKLEVPTQNTLLFSAHDNPNYIARAVALGANGFVWKSDAPEKILNSIRRAAAGESIWTREELRKVSNGLTTMRPGSESEIPLSSREGEVLKQLANGLTNREIAQALGISYETIKEHVQHILRKVGVTDRTQAAVWAVRRNLV